MGRYVFLLMGAICALAAHGQLITSEPELVNPWGVFDSADDRTAAIAADRNGVVIMMWHTKHDVAGSIGDDSDVAYVRSIDFGRNWSLPKPLNDHAAIDTPGSQGEADFDVHLATNGWRTWVAVWTYGFNDPNQVLAESGADWDIYFSVSPDDGLNWTDAAPLGSKMTTDQPGPTVRDDDRNARIATDGQGTWITVWTENLTTIYAARAMSTTLAWDAGQVISSGSGGRTNPAIASNGKGSWVIVWVENALSIAPGEVLFSVSDDNGASWSAPAELSVAGFPDQARNPDVVYNGIADRWLTVYASPLNLAGLGPDLDIVITSSVDGRTWLQPQALQDAATSDTSAETAPRFAKDGNMNWAVSMVRQQFGKGGESFGTDVAVAISTDNAQTFAGPFSIGDKVDGTTGSDMLPAITATAGPAWRAAWEAYNGTYGFDYDIIESGFGFTGSIAGRVTTAQNGEPIGCATVVATRLNTDDTAKAAVNANGNFRLEGLVTGDYTLDVVTARNIVSSEQATVDTADITLVKLSVDARDFPGALFGRVRQRNTENFIIDALVQVFQNDVLIATTRTCSTGQYAFFDLFSKLKGTENVDVMYSQDGYDDETQNVNVDPEMGTEVDQDLGLKSGPVLGSLTGQVVDGVTLQGIANATVTLQGGVFVSTFTDANGLFVFPELISAAYNATASAAGFDEQIVPSSIKASPDVNVIDFSLLPGMDSPAGDMDINADVEVNAIDVQLVINGALALDIMPYNSDVDLSGLTDAIDVQLVINAVLDL